MKCIELKLRRAGKLKERTIVLAKIIFIHIAFFLIGLRQAVAMGLDVISRRPNGELFQEMIDHPAPNYPDDLARMVLWLAADDTVSRGLLLQKLPQASSLRLFQYRMLKKADGQP